MPREIKHLFRKQSVFKKLQKKNSFDATAFCSKCPLMGLNNVDSMYEARELAELPCKNFCIYKASCENE